MKNLKKLFLFFALVSTMLICGMMTASATEKEWTPESDVAKRYHYFINDSQRGHIYRDFETTPILKDDVYYYKCVRYSYISRPYSYMEWPDEKKTVYCAVINGIKGSAAVRNVLSEVNGIPVELAYPRYNFSGIETVEERGLYYHISKKVLTPQSVSIPASVRHIIGDGRPNYMYTGCSLINAHGPIKGTLKYYTWLPAVLKINIDKNNPYLESSSGTYVYEIGEDGTKTLIQYQPLGLNPESNINMAAYSISSLTINGDIKEYAHYRSLGLPGTVKLGDKVKKVGDYAFYGANTEVKLSRNIEYIGTNAFYHCFANAVRAMNGWGTVSDGSVNYILNNTIKHIGYNAFDKSDTIYFLGTKEEFLKVVKDGELENCGTPRVYFNCRVDKDFELVHYDENFDRKCDSCATSTECNHICHKNNFFSKLCLFFWKLFKINQYCNRCGFEHYHL